MEKTNVTDAQKSIKKNRIINCILIGAGILAFVAAVIVAFCCSVSAGLFTLIGYPILYFMGFGRGWCCTASKILKEGVSSLVSQKEELLKGKTLLFDVTEKGYSITLADEVQTQAKKSKKKNTITQKA